MKVDIGRGSTIAVFVALPLLTLPIAGAIYLAFNAEETAVAVIGSLFAVFFAWGGVG